MSDLISRQAAIDALEREKSLVERPITETRWFDFGLRKAQDVLSELPSAQPEEVIPHRNYKYLSDYWCACGWHLGKKGDVKYCADCGRKVNWDG